ncbi:PREDICTED: putative F-box protein At4g09190 [Nicotiana attenuata]|uniref:putative F-box protein At4g09190 n=1 Tax=Nicotiana attenuata TaxID=49451 RepID=UPI0009048963|nr:PREDICTED: putative F-box protein At4g09190 [Nicotiana attenuata]
MEENKITANGNLYIPNEAVFGILKWLPAKSLMRFRCISKSFCSLISEPLFIQEHGKSFIAQFLVSHVTLTQKEVTYNLSQRKEHQDLACPIEYLDEPCFRNLQFMQSINGLVCLWNYDGDVAICNPFIKEHIFLPKVQPREKGFLSVTTYSFDPTSKKHKELMSHMIFNEDRKLVAKYSLFTIGVDKSWRERSNWTEIISLNNYVCIDGVIYFENIFGDDIAAFSIVGNEKLIRTIPFPKLISTMKKAFDSIPKIVDIKGHVAVLLDDKRFQGIGRILIYVLNGSSETETWLKHTVELPSEFIHTHGFEQWKYPLAKM